MAETASTGPQTRFWGILAKKGSVLRLLVIHPTAGARAYRYFRHKSGSPAQDTDFLGSSVAESPCTTMGPRKIWLKRPLRGPRSEFLGFLAVVGSPKKHECPGPPKRPKTQKNRNSAKMRLFHRNFCSWTPPTHGLGLTREQIFFRFWIDGPEIWPG